ncbi:15-hydroxyprostaglandin dehydrogenase [NAD(+)]-like [Uloborus diversus]|uniref:15-hydroxyprostaglandin dehydrogenase [NAD(+)]-like n=1 Tax=Uloborus diversus TaxID=327109 RepID=UPI00240A4621|nr:15-hydroxyprostaglandin dehydrogenase [NAD(+)]-like [Uloborus diversus]
MAESPVAIVTGGAQGLGAAISKALLHKGYRVCVSDINENKCYECVSHLQQHFGKNNVIFVRADVSKEWDVKNIFEKTMLHFNRVDVLANNAGILDEDNPRHLVDVNLMGVINGIRAAFEYMGTSHGGNGGIVINTASVLGLVPFDIIPVYTATKHAVVGLTRSYGLPYHYDNEGILFAALCPSYIGTDMLNDVSTKSLSKGLVVGDRPEIMSPDDVAKGFLKLLEDRINGSTLYVEKNAGFQYIGLPQEMKTFEL